MQFSDHFKTQLKYREAEGSSIIQSVFCSSRGLHFGSQHPCKQAHKTCNYNSRRSDTLSWHPWPLTHKQYIHTHTNKSKKINLKKKIHTHSHSQYMQNTLLFAKSYFVIHTYQVLATNRLIHCARQHILGHAWCRFQEPELLAYHEKCLAGPYHACMPSVSK